jgi:ABC-type multidrug transport system fused ATPase/permease subunit
MREQARAAWTLTKLAFRADRSTATAAYGLYFLQGIASAMTAWWLSRLVDAVIDGDGSRAVTVAAAMAITGGILGAAALLDLDMRFRIEESTGLLIDQELIATMASTSSLELHERPAHLDKIEVLRQQKAQISQSVSAILEFLAVGGTAITALGLLAGIHPLLLLFPAGGVFAVWTSARYQLLNQRMTEAVAERRRRAAHLFRVGTEAGPAKELRTFGLGPEIVRRHDELFASASDEVERLSLRWGVLTGVGWSTLGLLHVGATGFVAWRAVNGDASVGDVVLVVTLSDRVNAVVQQGVGLMSWLFGSLRAAARYLQVMEAASAVQSAEPADAAPAPTRLQRGIELDRVAFSYPDSREPVLRDISIALPAGSIVALVGENGAGKTTLVKLLARFYEPDDGTISVDGVDLQHIRAADWRTRLSGAFQDHARLELVASEVVGIGDLEHLDDRPAITAALDRAGAGQVADRLDRGLDTPLGRSFDDGIEPSGGQWQQLALGRALLRTQPLLLLLDEPTSALDPEAEHRLFEGYAAAARGAAGATGAITLLVSHRFSTVRMADLIVVMEDGTVSQSGTHDELMALGGTYAELFTMQARAYR